jgi:hypothetical protein
VKRVYVKGSWSEKGEVCNVSSGRKGTRLKRPETGNEDQITAERLQLSNCYSSSWSFVQLIVKHIVRAHNEDIQMLS